MSDPRPPSALETPGISAVASFVRPPAIFVIRLMTPEEFGEIVLLAQPDGTILHLKDVADIELGSESYTNTGSLPGLRIRTEHF